MKSDLQESLRDSLVLCKPHIGQSPTDDDYEKVFRTASLLPSAARLVKELMESHRSRSNRHARSLGTFVAAKRALVQQSTREKLDVKVDSKNTLILRTRIGVCLGDGLVPKETSGFIAAHKEFGTEELPPWDTWIGVVQAGDDVGLLSWVPAWGRTIVEEAIAADYLKMYSWHAMK
jgi:hypothetical protein